MANLNLTPLKLNTWRKIALGTWDHPGDPTVYGAIEINATKILERQKRYQPAKPPTITAIIARTAALTLHKFPQINGMIRWGRIYLREDVTLFLQTAVDEAGQELSGVSIPNAEKKSLIDIANELKEKAKAIREDRDPAFKQAKASFKIMPPFIMRYLLKLISFFIYTLNINLSFLKLPRDPFGSIMITSIGMLGLDEAFAPLVPYSRVPVLIAVGAIQKKAVVINDQITIAPMFKLCATFDHRFVDGVYAAKMAKHMRFLLETDEGLNSIGL